MARKLGLVGALGLGALALAGCDAAPPDNGFFHALRMGWPDGITPESKSMGNFWVWTWVVAWIIGLIMWGLMFLVMFRDGAKRAKKAGKGEFPRQTAYNVNLELALTAVPVIIVMGLFFFTVQTQDKVTAMDKDPQVTVDVTAYQWNWKFGYGEVKGSLTQDGADYSGADAQKKADSALLSQPTEVDEEGEIVGPIHGGSSEDFSYLNYDKIETVGTSEEVPVLVLPTNTPIEFNLASSDVIHSFWVPEFLFKRDVMPHPEKNHQERRFQIEGIEKEGAVVGRCAEMCGTYHAMMNFEIRAVSPDTFTRYLEFRKTNPDATNAEALDAVGEDPYATSTRPFLPDRAGTRSVDGDNYIGDAAA
ncbi:MAG: cytochrome c oxidase subunit II [Corynebacterium provencense]|jgi:cytochrome c oxidase subunit 2|uniref:aa3-type cytochrome oxidase subunit II n=1 Tax=Corynebacterium provencense TaxID=1737425 RepID=UPI002989D2BB|nr:cytochrome c oxidase subunit II [Corynebacterium provencense]